MTPARWAAKLFALTLVSASPAVSTDARAQEAQPVADDQVPEMPAAEAAPRVERIEIDPTLRAREACGYDEATTTWACEAAILERWQLRRIETVSGPDGLRAVGGAIPKDLDLPPSLVDASCLGRGVAVGIQAASEDVFVEWDQATLVVDGRAVAAVPAFARERTANLSQRVVRVPSGSSYVEGVFPLSDECALRAPQVGRPTSTMAQVKVRRGDRPELETITVTVTRDWVSAVERDAFALIDEPAQPEILEGEPSPPIPFARTLLFGGIAFGVVGAVGAALGAGVALAPTTSEEERAGMGGPVGAAAVIGGTFGVMAGAVGAIVGYVNGDVPARESYQQLARNHEQLTRDASKRRSWLLKRRSLGLSVPEAAAAGST